MTKRCFNTQESMAYLGLQRRFFDQHIAPKLKGKGIKAGTSIIYERADLDAAWESYKLTAGSERANEEKETWDVQKKGTSTRHKTGRMKLMHSTSSSAFEAAVSDLTARRKITSLRKNSE